MAKSYQRSPVAWFLLALVFNPLVALDGATGNMKFRVCLKDDEPVGMGHRKIFDRDPDEPGLQIAFFNGRECEGYVYSFLPDEPAGRQDLTFRTPERTRNFPPTLIIADMDGSDTPRVGGKERLCEYCGRYWFHTTGDNYMRCQYCGRTTKIKTTKTQRSRNKKILR